SPLKLRFIAYAKHHEKLYNRFIAPHHIIPENTRHAQAATALGEMGPMAQKAIPALLVASQDKDYIIACRATAALMKIRQESPDNLIALAADVSATSWNRTARTLKYLGTNAQAAVPLLIGELNHTKPWTRMMAAATLGGIASRPEISVPALTNCLTDSESLVRRSAIDALCKFKSEKQQIVPLLLARMQDPDLNVWLGAAFGLEELLTPDEKKTLLAPVLRRSLNSPVGIIAENASMFLRRMNAPPTTNAGVK
ncbi:MAG: repeat-containing protein, partial [Pedosphaera sp.]|nr:repeat-containing protein [Pedosphaera sp.]